MTFVKYCGSKPDEYFYGGIIIAVTSFKSRPADQLLSKEIALQIICILGPEFRNKSLNLSTSRIQNNYAYFETSESEFIILSQGACRNCQRDLRDLKTLAC